MGLQRTIAPTLEIVPLEQMKMHLRIDHADEDAYIQTLTDAAVAYLDGPKGMLGWCLGAQTWVLTYDAFPQGPIRLPTGPLVSVVSVQADGVLVDPSQYDVDATDERAWLVPVGSWPSVDSVNGAEITFVAGHASASTISPVVAMVVKLLVAHWYQNREAVSAGPMREVPMSAHSLLSSIRWMHV